MVKARLSLLAAFFALFWLSVSCGGKTSGEQASSGGSGGGGEAGSSGSAGDSGSSGSAAASDGGARLPADCTQPAESGSCLAYQPSYFHNALTGLCEPFVYGGCGGNSNRFATLAECQAACHGGSPDLDVCQTAIDCTLATPSCCSGCEETDAFALVALNLALYPEYARIKGCEHVTCDACPTVDELSATAQYFVPACEHGQCTVVDLRLHPITACGSDSQCVVRHGSNCCSTCGSGRLIAINSNADIGILCPVMEPCPAPCPIDPQYVARCLGGRCTVTRL